MLARNGNDLFIKVEFDALRGRIAGKVQHQHLGPWPRVLDGLFQLGEKVHVRTQRHVADVGAGDCEAVGVNRIGRVGHQDRVTGPAHGQRQVRQSLLGTDGDDGIAFRIQVDGEAPVVPVTDGLAQSRDAA